MPPNMGTGRGASKYAAVSFPPMTRSPMIRSLLPAALVVLALSAPLTAQPDDPAVRVGARVRVTLSEQLWTVEGVRDPQVLRGVLRSITRDSLRLQLHPGASPVSVSRSAVARVDVSLGVPSRAESALRGAVLNAAVFAGSNLLIRSVDNDSRESAGDAALRGAAVGGAFGAVAGAVLVRERWRRARIPQRVRMRVGISPQGANLVASLRF